MKGQSGEAAGRRRRLTRRSVVLAGGALALAAACGGEKKGTEQGNGAGSAPATAITQTAQGPPKPGGVYRTATTAALGVLDPQNSVNAVSQATTPLVYNYVMRTSVLAADKGIVWDLGTAYENPEPATWVFKLRPDAVIAKNKYGIPERPLDAEDVKANFERAGNPMLGYPGLRWLRTYVDRMEAPDATTFRLTTKGPYAWVLANVGNNLASVVAPREWLTKPELRTDAVGAGPFIVRVFLDGQGSRLEKNPTYYVKDRPYLEGYEMKQFGDLVTWRAAFLSGQVETYGATNADEAKEILNQKKDLQYSQDPSFQYLCIWLNTRVAPWNDPRARRAVARAINRGEYVQLIGRGQGEPIGPITAPMKPYSLPPDELSKAQPFDANEARQLFQAAGVKEFGFTFSTAGQNMDYVNIVVRQLQAVGVTAKPEPLDPGVWAQGLLQNKPDASLVGPPEFSDPDFALNPFTTTGPLKAGRYDTGFSDPEIDAAADKAARTLNEQDRIKAYHEAQRLILRKDPAWLNLVALFNNNLTAPYVRGFQRGIGQLATAYAKDLWLEK